VADVSLWSVTYGTRRETEYALSVVQAEGGDVSEQIRVHMSTVHETGGYHNHSAHVEASEVEAVVLEVLDGITTQASHDNQKHGMTMMEALTMAVRAANRTRDIPEGGEECEPDEIAETVPGDAVQALMDDIAQASNEGYAVEWIEGGDAWAKVHLLLDPQMAHRDIPDDAPDPERVKEYVNAAAQELADTVPPFLSNASGGPAMTSASFVGDLKVGGDVAPETIPAEPVRELLRRINEKVQIRESEYGGGQRGFDAFWDQYWIVCNILAKQDLSAPDPRVEKCEEPKPHGTVDAHLAEQMRHAAFRAAFEAEGESELRKAARVVLRAAFDYQCDASLPVEGPALTRQLLQLALERLARALETTD